MLKSPIIQTRTVPDSAPLGGVHPLLSRIYTARGITDVGQLDYSLAQLLKPTLLGLDKAVQIISQAIHDKKRILIAGDFDADGATSTVLMLRMLRAMGAEHLNYVVPNRFEFGYGLSKELVEYAQQYKPELIITVDNGISSVEGVAYAQSLGIEVVVTDHHLPPPTLPSADAIVNPNLEGDTFASKCLAGVGVAFYVMVALRAHLRSLNYFNEHSIKEPDLREVLDLVALGTVADVVPLDFNNRLLVTQGLHRIRQGLCSVGITALLKIAKRPSEQLQASDLGFAVAPRLNAAGRLEDMSVGIECLLTKDMQRAQMLAAELDEINQTRRDIETQMKQEAFNTLDKLQKELDGKENTLPSGLCLYHQDWHAGVVGIVASRVKEKYHRPVVAFAKEDEYTLKGSARSVAGLHIKDVFESLHTQTPGLMSKFGGHAMAAGLTLPIEHYDEFQQYFSQRVQEVLGDHVGQVAFETDGQLNASDMTLLTADRIDQAGPWGQGFPEPTFYGEFILLDKRILKEVHLKMVVSNGTKEMDAIAFNEIGENLPEHLPCKIELVYKLSVNFFRGRRTLQLMVDYIRPVMA